MAKRKKSESRKLAELIAKQRGIKVRSAQSWLSRVASGKVKKPKYDLKTDYAKRKVRQYVAAAKAKPKAARAQKPIAAIPEPIRRASFPADSQHLLSVRARFNFYGNDNRDRKINLNVTGEELNAFMNADGADRALQSLTRTANGQFLQGADISDMRFFSVDGQMNGPEFFD